MSNSCDPSKRTSRRRNLVLNTGQTNGTVNIKKAITNLNNFDGSGIDGVDADVSNGL